MKSLIFILLVVTLVLGDSDIFLNEDQHPGFVKLKDKDDLFFWLFKSRGDKNSDPLVIWLTGGPGCSSELAIFYENGPFSINQNLTLKKNNYSWNERTNLLYVDQPIGTGFSHGEKKDFVHNETMVAKDFYQFMEGFLEQFPEYKGRDLYITGESYAGHYVPAISAHLHQKKNPDINLKGSAIGNGLVNPYLQYPEYATYAYENKLVSKMKYKILQYELKECQKKIKSGDWDKALLICNIPVEQILGDPQKFNTYDIRKPCTVPGLCYNFSLVDKFLAREDVIEALNVKGRKWSSCNMDVHSALMGDWMRNLSQKVIYLLKNDIKVLVYAGDKDFICNWRGNEMWTNELSWSYQQEFKNQQYQEVFIDKVSYGQIKVYKNFAFYRVYEAGHMVPMDQPKAALKMLNHFIYKWSPDSLDYKLTKTIATE